MSLALGQAAKGTPTQRRRWPIALWGIVVPTGFALVLSSSSQVFMSCAGLGLLGLALLCLQHQGAARERVTHERLREGQLWQDWLAGSHDAITLLALRHDGMGRPMGYTVTHANAQAQALFAHIPQGLVGASLQELFPDGLHESFHQRLQTACATGTPQMEEHVVRQWRADGHTEPRWLHHQIIPGAGGLTLVSRDTTEAHQSIDALREQETFYRKLVDCLPMPVFARSTRAHNAGRFVVWNRAAAEVMARPAREALGRMPEDVLPPAQAQRGVEMDQFVMRTGYAHRFPTLTYSTPHGDREVDMTKVPVYGVDGQLDHILSIAQDVTDARRSAEQLRLASRVIDETGDAVVVSDALDRIVMVNPAFTALSGLDAAQALGRSAELVGLSPLRETHLPGIEQALRDGQRWSGESHQLAHNDRMLDTWMSVSTLRNEAQGITQHIRVFSDISVLKAQQRELAEQARHDSLTGLPNRRAFGERLAQAMARARRQPHTLAVLYVDLDGFKAVNDLLGHAAGDQLLAEVARRLLQCVRLTDGVCRLAGDEFTVILEGAGLPHEVERICKRIVAQVSLPHLIDQRTVVCSPSIGAAVFEASDTAESLCQRADAAMYAAKRAGKACFVVSPPVPTAPETPEVPYMAVV